MDSGIYKLTFEDGSMYVGKSIDMLRRWKEHINKFQKGTAAKDLQHKYNCYGLPDHSILHICHPDHVDLLESIYIDRYWGSLLNTTRSNLVPDYDKEFLLEHAENLEFSTADHIRTLVRKINELEHSEEKYNNLLNRDEFVKNLQEENEDLWKAVALNKQEITRLKNRGFFERLFNT